MTIVNKHFPQVLLFGNGLNIPFSGISWNEFLKKISCNKDLDPTKLNIPMPLKAILLTKNNIHNSLSQYKNDLYGKVESDIQREYLEKILSLEFDHILTTNYSYELEIASQGSSGINDNCLKKLMKHTSSVKKAEGKYLLHTYNECDFKGHTNKIWHIHGEARKQSSIILGHYYYAGLLCKIKKYLDDKGKEYYNKQIEGTKANINSWMDAFILGDVYVLGFGYDFSEFDLWWLLDRKEQEKANKGKVYYFTPEPYDLDEKLELLKIFNTVEIKHCGIKMPATKEGCSNEFFEHFYDKAISQIESMITADDGIKEN